MKQVWGMFLAKFSLVIPIEDTFTYPVGALVIWRRHEVTVIPVERVGAKVNIPGIKWA